MDDPPGDRGNGGGAPRGDCERDADRGADFGNDFGVRNDDGADSGGDSGDCGVGLALNRLFRKLACLWSAGAVTWKADSSNPP